MEKESEEKSKIKILRILNATWIKLDIILDGTK